jgi:hypothetical protein
MITGEIMSPNLSTHAGKRADERENRAKGNALREYVTAQPTATAAKR